MLPVWYRLRAQVTEPRLGSVRFRSRSKSTRLGWVIGLLTLTLLFGIALAMTRGSLPRGLEDAVSAQSHLLLGGTLAFLLAMQASCSPSSLPFEQYVRRMRQALDELP